MELQQWVLFALLTSHKISRTAVNNVTLLGSRVNCPMLLPHFKQIWNLSTHFFKGFDTKFRGNSSNVNCAYTLRQTDRRSDGRAVTR
jgi:hypothetical protein